MDVSSTTQPSISKTKLMTEKENFAILELKEI